MYWIDVLYVKKLICVIIEEIAIYTVIIIDMSTNNRYSFLAEDNTKEEEPMVIASVQENKSENVVNPSGGNNNHNHNETIIKKLSFIELIHVFENAYVEKTKSNIYGKTFYDETPKIRALIDQLCNLYSAYNSDEMNQFLWNKTLRVFNITNDNKPYRPRSNDGAPIQAILRLICAQIRMINDNDLLIKSRRVGQDHVDLSAQFNVICDVNLGEQYETTTNERVIKCEPLVDELHRAIDLAKSASIKEREAKQAQYDSFKEAKEAKIAAIKRGENIIKPQDQQYKKFVRKDRK